MRGVINKIKGIFKAKPFNILQIEITSRCNARCIMCPKTHLGDWKSGDMDELTFSGISKAFPLADYVHLQGWGEPLLHTELYNMIKRIKKAGTKCGFTTNGQLLSQDRIKSFIDLGVDVIAISMAGADKKMHEYIRRGTDFKKIVESAACITNEKERLSLKKPELVLLFIMTLQNVHQLPAFVELGADVGAIRVVPNNVDFVPCKEIDELRAFNRTDMRKEYEELMAKTREKARERKVELRLYPLFPEEQGICEASPLKNLYISFDGCVSPCVYLGLPVDNIPIYRDGGLKSIPRRCFGNVREESLMDIWKKREYVNFRDIFKKRKNISIIETMISVFGFGAEGKKRLPAPDDCVECYKLFGF